MRWFVDISYQGGHYRGWQTQPCGRTVQDVVTRALRVLCRERVVLTGSGRTDAGVHATGQVAHFDTVGELSASFLRAINAMLPCDIALTNCRAVGQEAHARYTATHRLYHYHIHTRKSPFLHGKSHYLPLHGRSSCRGVRITLMNQAIRSLLGWRDFAAFSKKSSVPHTNCCLHHARWRQEADALHFEIVANRFLRGMVRSLAGNLLAVGMGKMSSSDFFGLLHGKKVGSGGFNLPPEGLYLVKVSYPEEIFLRDSVHEQANEGVFFLNR